MQTESPPYHRGNPFLATIKERYSLCKSGSKKNTQHIVIDLANSGITYRVGDSIGIAPRNDPILVQETLQAMKAVGDEIVIEKQSGNAWELRAYLTQKANLNDVSKKLLMELCQKQTNLSKKAFLEGLLEDSNKEALKQYLAEHHLWDFLMENAEAIFSPQELSQLFMPLLPRLYSISSSMKAVGEEVHLTVAQVQYESNGHFRRGVCTYYLCNLAPLHQPVVPVYIQPAHGFTLPENPEVPIIMIGPGTGVAPFRAFMQERISTQAAGKNWLFFGECHRHHNYFYEEFWQALSLQGKLRLEAVFSRDQESKVYVQHRMLEQGAELFRWLEEGAFLYICGDAQRMAKDVEIALAQIVQTHGGCDDLAAKSYIKRLRSEKRYLRDVY